MTLTGFKCNVDYPEILDLESHSAPYQNNRKQLFYQARKDLFHVGFKFQSSLFKFWISVPQNSYFLEENTLFPIFGSFGHLYLLHELKLNGYWEYAEFVKFLLIVGTVHDSADLKNKSIYPDWAYGLFLTCG